MRYFGATNQYVGVAHIHWPNGNKPRDIPECGFDGGLCPELPFWDILAAPLLTILVFLLAIAILICGVASMAICVRVRTLFTIQGQNMAVLL
ncbi:unnamed protein product [Oppiella nova]|uniref:Uncharacterized protein n=1 Tax=Oppiella nova TaxID=334625 RepID=A0A7R9MF01_9ACAR|nr:unnamed protein product [Oppiella nova]CAG2176164.1 unnamed protein product [Oppiella nova]